MSTTTVQSSVTVPLPARGGVHAKRADVFLEPLDCVTPPAQLPMACELPSTGASAPAAVDVSQLAEAAASSSGTAAKPVKAPPESVTASGAPPDTDQVVAPPPRLNEKAPGEEMSLPWHGHWRLERGRVAGGSDKQQRG
jgi:hypothetical protein